jgi:hypothetical protein
MKKTKKEIVIGLLQKDLITFEEALTLVEKEYQVNYIPTPPPHILPYNPFNPPYTITCNNGTERDS